MDYTKTSGRDGAINGVQGMEEFVRSLPVPGWPLTVEQLLGILSGHARRSNKTRRKEDSG